MARVTEQQTTELADTVPPQAVCHLFVEGARYR